MKRKPKKIAKAYILSDDSVVSADQYHKNEMRKRSKIERKKLIDAIGLAAPPKGSRALQRPGDDDVIMAGDEVKIVQPPADIQTLDSAFMVNPIHYRCCLIKAEDVTSKGYILERKTPQTTEDTSDASDATVDKEIKQAMELLNSCFGGRGGKAVADTTLVDQQSIGWGVIEVIRTVDGRIIDLVPHASKYFRWTKDGFILQVIGEKRVRFIPFGKKFVFNKNHKVQDVKGKEHAVCSK